MKTMNVLRVARITLAAAALLLSAPALAQGGEARASGDPGKMKPRQHPCRADVVRLCKDVQRGEGRIKRCLKDHAADLSQGCKDAIKNGAEALRGERRRVCSG